MKTPGNKSAEPETLHSQRTKHSWLSILAPRTDVGHGNPNRRTLNNIENSSKDLKPLKKPI